IFDIIATNVLGLQRVWDYSGFGTKLSPFFGFATRAIANRRSKSFKYKTSSPLSQLPKSVVVAVVRSYYFRHIL
ncbi:MAG: hypothetical protein V4698_04800, partial [Bacteroidota bacterium]